MVGSGAEIAFLGRQENGCLGLADFRDAEDADALAGAFDRAHERADHLPDGHQAQAPRSLTSGGEPLKQPVHRRCETPTSCTKVSAGRTAPA